jgi:ABC-2 type transport system permease protein
MRKYWEMTKSAMKLATAYQAWYWAGMAGAIFKLIIVYYFWHAVYENRTEVGAMTLETMITYQVLAMLLGNYSTSGAGSELARLIREGGVAIELLRPYDLLTKTVANEIGFKINTTFQSTIPLVIIGFLFMELQLPASWGAGVLFIVSAMLGVLLATFFDQIIGVLAFWTVNIFGLGMLKNAVFLFFTGALVPISLFPQWLQTLSSYLPFQAMVYLPVSIYTGQLAGEDAYLALGMQMIWILVIFAAVRVFWALAVRKVTIFGG